MLGIDKALGRVWIIALLLALALLANVTYVQGFQAQALRDDPNNARQFAGRTTLDRGPITAGGERLAYSVKVGDKRYQRKYVDSAVFSPITGYFSLYSQSGVEGAENRILDGTDARLATTSLVDRLLGHHVPGGTVETTIDPRAQRAAYAALRASGARRAAAVVIDASTGAIRTLASYPSFDANDVSTLNAKQADQAFRRLNAAPLKPMLDKATGEVFPPGSTFKTIVSAADLAGGATTATQVGTGRSYRPPGAGQPINNDEGDIGGLCDRPAIPLLDAYAQSCNTTFARMGAESPGNGAIADQAAKYGFYQRIDIEKGMSAAPSSFPRTDQPSLSALGSIGQGSTVATPLQMALVAAATINDGEVMQPYLVDKLRGGDGSTVESARPHRMARPLTSDQADAMRAMMREVVRTGTGKQLQGSRVGGGKTGTADIDGVAYNDRWFIGFESGSRPKYAVAVMTEADGYGLESGKIAARVLASLKD
ncbi:penicillin-binding transpeptidase domain-containing protein [Actinomadura atramentaria]|uniref:penicillin-binding transpeptidase domain-containing protein n=1 Tax=Actinomadura atramentaria TaxID=1990 RepID=UPI0003631E33|nr:penicillin-binding transpeptidase domain-containing protein [Actinomadura atramentaria]